jgi:hypothetical protein
VSQQPEEVVEDVELVEEPDDRDEHVVRILFQLPADNPKDAIDQFIEQIVEHGLRTWTYRVENLATAEIVNMDGYGEVKE